MNSIDENSKIFNKLKSIFKERFDMDINIELMDKNLLGCDFGLAPRDLLYLLDDIEKEFDFQIPQEDIAQNKFNSLYNIIKIIEENQFAYKK